ncbi:hypothetical protein, partial [Paenibacillus sp. GM2]|uniref:hypothetical protein n=1 Tax=Paenibacillus sp. GM2 TaxID=1622070 RepID=UPI001E5B0D8E
MNPERFTAYERRSDEQSGAKEQHDPVRYNPRREIGVGHQYGQRGQQQSDPPCAGEAEAHGHEGEQHRRAEGGGAVRRKA